MNTLYKIIGEDGKEYGPATFAQIRQWIGEGRVESRTPVFTEGAKDWNFVGLLPEFAGCFTSAATPPAIAPPLQTRSVASEPAKTNSYAQAGMICGILSVVCCCCGFPFGVLGLVFSLIGLSQIKANPHMYGGRGMAIAGLILSIVSLMLGAGSLLTNLLLTPPQVMWNFGHF
jgi:hypothetical protein